jgi:hypothetical protein
MNRSQFKLKCNCIILKYKVQKLSTCSSEHFSEKEMDEAEPELSVSPVPLSVDFLRHSQLLLSISAIYYDFHFTISDPPFTGKSSSGFH